MKRHYAFNGDADGLCALQQLRLDDPSDAVLVTGVKRDIELLRRVDAAPGDSVVVLDISLDRNRTDLLRLLASGASVRYFDHHYAGEIPRHPHLAAHIEETADVCTSMLVDRVLSGRHHRWAIVAAFGDGLAEVGAAMAAAAGLAGSDVAILSRLGTTLNYNAYGSTISDLHFDPTILAAQMLPFDDPIDFARRARAFGELDARYQDDMHKARALRPTRETPGAAVLILPNEAWARRAIGVLANEFMQARPQHAIAMLAPAPSGGFSVSVRVPPGRSMGADEFCRMFETGGGRRQAAGINHLADSDVEHFGARFLERFGAR